MKRALVLSMLAVTGLVLLGARALPSAVAELDVNGVRIQLDSCYAEETELRCRYVLESQTPNAHVVFTANGSRATTPEGKDLPALSVRIGERGGRTQVTARLLPRAPLAGEVVFPGVRSEVNELPSLLLLVRINGDPLRVQAVDVPIQREVKPAPGGP